jgi:hypothetical protein
MRTPKAVTMMMIAAPMPLALTELEGSWPREILMRCAHIDKSAFAAKFICGISIAALRRSKMSSTRSASRQGQMDQAIRVDFDDKTPR